MILVVAVGHCQLGPFAVVGPQLNHVLVWFVLFLGVTIGSLSEERAASITIMFAMSAHLWQALFVWWARRFQYSVCLD